MFMFQTLKYLPSKIFVIDGEVLGIGTFSLAFALWLFVPFWDRKSARGEENRFLNYIGIFAIMYIILFTILGWLS